MSLERNIIINSSNFLNSKIAFDKKIGNVEDIFNNLSSCMKKIEGNNDIWRSDTSVAVYEKYLELEKKFKEINIELNTYSIFLKETLENYKEEDLKENKTIEQESSSLDM